MSRAVKSRRRRREVLRELAEAGRKLSDAAVMFHTALSAKVGLGASDWKTLGFLEKHGPLTAGELSELSGLAPPSVTGIIDRLEGGGWVRRGQDPRDGRRVVVEMDPAGLAAVVPHFAGLLRGLDEVYARYSDEELELIVKAMREIAECQTAATRELDAEPSSRARGQARRRKATRSRREP